MVRTQATTKDTNRTKESQRIVVLRLHIFRVIRAFRGQSIAAAKMPGTCQRPLMALAESS